MHIIWIIISILYSIGAHEYIWAYICIHKLSDARKKFRCMNENWQILCIANSCFRASAEHPYRSSRSSESSRSSRPSESKVDMAASSKWATIIRKWSIDWIIDWSIKWSIWLKTIDLSIHDYMCITGVLIFLSQYLLLFNFRAFFYSQSVNSYPL